VAQPRSAIASLAGAIDFDQPERESANLDRAEAWMHEAARVGARILAFPELFPGPSTPASDLDATGVWTRLGELAVELGLAVGFGGLVTAEEGHHNGYHLLDGRSGKRVTQLKELPAIGEMTAPGTGGVLLDVDGLRVGVAICWEAWFPEIVRARALSGADLVLCPAGGIVAEIGPQWLTLVAARAIENNCYSACSVNLVGVERGMAGIFGPEGALGVRDGEGLVFAELDLDRLDRLRAEDEELTPIKRFATIPGLLRALPEHAVERELAVLREWG